GPLRLNTAKDPTGRENEEHRNRKADHRREEDRGDRLGGTRGFHGGEAAVRYPGAKQSADQGMAGRGRDALEPRDDVPEHRADQRAEYHRRTDDVLVDDPTADRFGDMETDDPVGGEV